VRRLSVLAVLVASVVLAVAPAASAPSDARTFVPGVELGGARLGMTKAEILRSWGRKHGVCADCRRETWYFNDRPFQPQGTGVVFRNGRAVQLFTVWKPAGWETRDGLSLGADGGDVGAKYGEVTTRRCRGYEALVLRGKQAESIFYVYADDVWGFGLQRPGVNPCL
jgi:hypothetical protein